MRKTILWNAPDDSYEVDCPCNFDDRNFVVDGDTHMLVCEHCGYQIESSAISPAAIELSDLGRSGDLSQRQ